MSANLTTLDAPRLLLGSNNEPRIDTRWLADGLGIRHKSLIETVRRYESEMQTFGLLPFETEAVT